MNKILERQQVEEKNVNKEKMPNLIIHKRNAKQSHDDIASILY